MPPPPTIHPDIRQAQTLPARFYGDPVVFQAQRERIFARSWQLVPSAHRMKAGGHVLPFTLLEGCLDEPLLLANGDDGETRCISNVCTHRGMLVVEGEGHARTLRCRYHGRRFGLDGAFLSMPEFEEVENFPCPADDLPRLPLHRWGPLAFTSIEPSVTFHDWIGPVRERMDWLPLDRFVFDAESSHDYLITANWALYCDNYLEEFHIPYVHQMTLGDALDYSTYRTELFEHCNVQLGTGKQGDSLFDLPADHPDSGTPMAAYYFWLFPNLMLNFYPWGLSVNLVTPLGPDRTRISFLSYVWRPELRAHGAGSELHRVEMEDEEVVEAVQKGVRSRLYNRGRFSPRRETGVHHFHRLLADLMQR